MALGNAMSCGDCIAVDAFFELHDGGDRSEVARKYAEALAECAKDSPCDENRALLTGFLERLLELNGW